MSEIETIKKEIVVPETTYIESKYKVGDKVFNNLYDAGRYKKRLERENKEIKLQKTNIMNCMSEDLDGSFFINIKSEEDFKIAKDLYLWHHHFSDIELGWNLIVFVDGGDYADSYYATHISGLIEDAEDILKELKSFVI